MVSKADFLLNTGEPSPYRIIDRFAEEFDIKNAKELVEAISTTLNELINNNNNEQSEIFVQWKQTVETRDFQASCTRYFSKKAADEASALETTLSLCCIISGKRSAATFFVDISSTMPVAWLKETIMKQMPGIVDDASDLDLFRVEIPAGMDVPIKTILAKDIVGKEEMVTTVAISDYFEDGISAETIHIIVKSKDESLDQKLKRKISEDRWYAFAAKRIRILEGWKEYKAADGNTVELPPELIEIFKGTNCEPAARVAFAHLKADLQVGIEIDIPSMGQIPKALQLDSQGTCKLLVTKQMLDIWEEIQDGADGNRNRLYKRILTGSMGVGKTYLSYFLAARAYAEGWPVIYIADTGRLDTSEEEESAMNVITYFLALNKDILTAADLGRLVHHHRSKCGIPISAVFEELLKWDRDTLLIVDEHWKLFRKATPVPDKFPSLDPLFDFSWWSDEYKGPRVIFTGTSHEKYEMTYLDDKYRPDSVIFVGPLQKDVFSKLLERYPRLNGEDIREQVLEITNCVPGELICLAGFIEDEPDPITTNTLKEFMTSRAHDLKGIAKEYYYKLDSDKQQNFYDVLSKNFLGNTSTADFDSDFIDLGLVYRLNDGDHGATRNQILCPAARKGLLDLFKLLPPHRNILNLIRLGEQSEDEFEDAILLQLISSTWPVILNATDLNNRNKTTVSFDFEHCETIGHPNASLGTGHGRVLSRGRPNYPCFDFILDSMFIQVSNSDFRAHQSKETKNIRKAFEDRDEFGKNQIERYMDEMFGSGHSANIDPETKKFIVTRNGAVVPGFQIVYIRGSSGTPDHSGLVKRYPDVLHVTFEEIKEKLFRRIH